MELFMKKHKLKSFIPIEDMILVPCGDYHRCHDNCIEFLQYNKGRTQRSLSVVLGWHVVQYKKSFIFTFHSVILDTKKMKYFEITKIKNVCGMKIKGFIPLKEFKDALPIYPFIYNNNIQDYHYHDCGKIYPFSLNNVVPALESSYAECGCLKHVCVCGQCVSSSV